MRRVSNATCTSGDPVSESLFPYVPTTSCFASFVRVISRRLAKVRHASGDAFGSLAGKKRAKAGNDLTPGIAAGHPATAQAGLEILAEGGTAADASCAVPGVPAGLGALHRRHGRLRWARLLQPAISLA